MERRRAVLRLAGERRVEVVEESVADVDGVLGGIGDEGPEVELLMGGAVVGVVAVEGVEGAESGPAGAEFLVC